MPDVNQVDQYLLELINRHAIPGFDGFFRVSTHFGSVAFWLAAFAAYSLVGKKKLIAAIFILALLFGTVINEDIKNIVQRERPEGAIVGAALTPVNYSFPSQHAQTAFMLAALATALLGIKYGLFAYIFAGYVALSRMYLGVHYLTDVAAGAVIGIVIGELAMLALYFNGVTKKTGLTGRIIQLAGIVPPVEIATRGQMIVGLIIFLTGTFIATLTMLTGQYIVSLVFIALTYIAILKLPLAYAFFKA